MRVIHTVPGVIKEAGGPSYSVLRLCDSLVEIGADVSLATLAWPQTISQRPYIKQFRFGIGPRRLGISPDMKSWLKSQVKTGMEIVHNHSLFMMPNVYSGQVCRNSHAKLIVSPRGTFSGWALQRNALIKQIFWRFLQGPAVREAACFHVTSYSEYLDVRRMGFTQPVCVIPNGIDIPPLEFKPKMPRRKVLFLGRIHPVKGIDILLNAWSVLEGRFPEWDLEILGPSSDGYQQKMMGLARDLNLTRVSFGGAVYGVDKVKAYQSAELFVLPTHTENFGVAVAEALASAIPVVVTKGAPWRGLEKHGAGWWIDNGAASLVHNMDLAMRTDPTVLAKMGRAGREWMIREYSWGDIGQSMFSVYGWIMHGGQRPESILLD